MVGLIISKHVYIHIIIFIECCLIYIRLLTNAFTLNLKLKFHSCVTIDRVVQ